MTPHQRLAAILAKKGLMDTRADIIANFTNGRTSSLRQLTDAEAMELCTRLGYTPPMALGQKDPRYDSWYRMGSKIIAQLVRLGYEKLGSPDYDRINAYIQTIGTNNPRQVQLWQLNYDEMYQVAKQIDARYRKTNPA